MIKKVYYYFMKRLIWLNILFNTILFLSFTAVGFNNAVKIATCNASQKQKRLINGFGNEIKLTEDSLKFISCPSLSSSISYANFANNLKYWKLSKWRTVTSHCRWLHAVVVRIRCGKSLELKIKLKLVPLVLTSWGTAYKTPLYSSWLQWSTNAHHHCNIPLITNAIWR